MICKYCGQPVEPNPPDPKYGRILPEWRHTDDYLFACFDQYCVPLGRDKMATPSE